MGWSMKTNRKSNISQNVGVVVCGLGRGVEARGSPTSLNPYLNSLNIYFLPTTVANLFKAIIVLYFIHRISR